MWAVRASVVVLFSLVCCIADDFRDSPNAWGSKEGAVVTLTQTTVDVTSLSPEEAELVLALRAGNTALAQELFNDARGQPNDGAASVAPADGGASTDGLSTSTNDSGDSDSSGPPDSSTADSGCAACRKGGECGACTEPGRLGEFLVMNSAGTVKAASTGKSLALVLRGETFRHGAQVRSRPMTHRSPLPLVLISGRGAWLAVALHSAPCHD